MSLGLTFSRSTKWRQINIGGALRSVNGRLGLSGVPSSWEMLVRHT